MFDEIRLCPAKIRQRNALENWVRFQSVTNIAQKINCGRQLGHVDMWICSQRRRAQMPLILDITADFPNLSTIKVGLSTTFSRLIPHLSTKNWPLCGKVRSYGGGNMGYRLSSVHRREINSTSKKTILWHYLSIDIYMSANYTMHHHHNREDNQPWQVWLLCPLL